MVMRKAFFAVAIACIACLQQSTSAMNIEADTMLENVKTSKETTDAVLKDAVAALKKLLQHSTLQRFLN